jgi:hypothetical protein
MTEKEIELLGFEKNTDYDGKDPFYYYTYTIAQGFEFISNANDEVKDNQWYIEFFDSHPQIRFYEFEEVQSLINLLTKRIVK